MAEHARNHFTNTFPLIGLIGKARAGKDTFAARLVEKHGYRRLAFADALKALAFGIDPIVVPGDEINEPLRLSEAIDLYGEDVAKANIPEIRRLWQRLGAEVREKLGAGVWRDIIMHVVDLRSGPVVITDVRYRNEAQAIAERGGKLVRIVRAGAGTGDGNASHASETELDDWPTDWVIKNDRSVQNLQIDADWLGALLQR